MLACFSFSSLIFLSGVRRQLWSDFEEASNFPSDEKFEVINNKEEQRLCLN